MLNVSVLVDSLEAGVIWSAGRGGGGHFIECPLGALPLMGVYNPARAQAIQVLGVQELRCIEHRGGDGPEAVELFHDDARLVIVAGGARVPVSLEQQADEHGVALLRSDLDEGALLALLYRRMARLCAPSTRLHGVLISVSGVGTLILGAEGTGKSSLALELLGRGHQLIVDDDVDLYRDGDGSLWGGGQGPSGLRGFLFVRGLGMIDVVADFGAFALGSRLKVVQVVRLDYGPLAKPERQEPVADGLDGDQERETVLGVDLPCLRIRSLNTAADRLESYTRRRLLAAVGYDVPAAFRARHTAMLNRKRCYEAHYCQWNVRVG
jgi:HPr kinase/phosphorylase